MPLSSARVVSTAESVSQYAEQLVDLYAKINDLLEFNSDQAIDWAAQNTPAYIPEDGDGNIDGLTFSRQAVANAIGTMAQFRNLLTNQTVTEGDHLGNLNVISPDAA